MRLCDSLLRKQGKEKQDASVLYEVPRQEGNEESDVHQNEERQAGD